MENGMPLPEAMRPAPSVGPVPDGVDLRARLEGVGAIDRHEVIASLYRAERVSVFQFVLGMVGEHALAEDLTHDAFLAAHGAVGQLKDLERSRAWLYAIARNVVRQYQRRQRLIRWVRWDDHVVARSGDDDGALTDIVATLARLSPDDREIVLLKGLLEFTAREIAEILGIREEAAQQRWHRARERFRAVEAGEGTGVPVTLPPPECAPAPRVGDHAL